MALQGVFLHAELGCFTAAADPKGFAPCRRPPAIIFLGLAAFCSRTNSSLGPLSCLDDHLLSDLCLCSRLCGLGSRIRGLSAFCSRTNSSLGLLSCLDDHLLSDLCLCSRLRGLGSRIRGLSSRIRGLGTQIRDLRCRIGGLGAQIHGLGSRICGLGSRISGLGSLSCGLAGSLGSLARWLAGLLACRLAGTVAPWLAGLGHGAQGRNDRVRPWLSAGSGALLPSKQYSKQAAKHQGINV